MTRATSTDRPEAAGKQETTLAQRRRARCVCGTLSVIAVGEPEAVYLCGCDACRRGSGAPFAWRARYPKAAVEVFGTARMFRRHGDAGRWIDQAFCETCGAGVYQTAQALPDHFVIAAGCFETHDDLPPSRLFRGEKLISWCTIDFGVATATPTPSG